MNFPRGLSWVLFSIFSNDLEDGLECTLSRLASIKLGEFTNTVDGRNRIQSNFNKLDK